MGKRRTASLMAILFASRAVGSRQSADEKCEKLLDGRDERYDRTSASIRQAAGATFYPAKGSNPHGVRQTVAWRQTEEAAKTDNAGAWPIVQAGISLAGG
jgi:hypothetical protein